MAPTSWYVETECIEIDSLQPISLVIISVFIQAMISFFVFSTEEGSTAETELSVNLVGDVEAGSGSSGFVSGLKRIANSRYVKCVQYLFLIWQFVSVISVLVLDMIHISNTISKYEMGWNRYQCLAAMLLTSSNTKTLTINGLVIMYTGGDVLECKTLSLKEIFTVMCYALLSFEILAIMPYWMSVIVYIWFAVGLEFLFFALAGCVYLMPGTKKKSLSIPEDAEENGLGFIGLVLAYSIVLSFLICGLAAVNLYSGMGYWISFQSVFTERHWIHYWNHVKSEAVEGFRFMTWLL